MNRELSELPQSSRGCVLLFFGGGSSFACFFMNLSEVPVAKNKPLPTHTHAGNVPSIRRCLDVSVYVVYMYISRDIQIYRYRHPKGTCNSTTRG